MTHFFQSAEQNLWTLIVISSSIMQFKILFISFFAEKLDWYSLFIFEKKFFILIKTIYHRENFVATWDLKNGTDCNQYSLQARILSTKIILCELFELKLYASLQASKLWVSLHTDFCEYLKKISFGCVLYQKFLRSGLEMCVPCTLM